MNAPVRGFIAACLISLWLGSSAAAQNQDFNTYTQEDFPATSGFSAPNWSVGGGGASAGETGNSWQTVLYGTQPIHNTRITGTIDFTNGTGEDDIAGLVLGFDPGDATNPDASYALIDWKGNTQSFDYSGFGQGTPGTTAGRGLALSQVQGAPTADELWGKTNIGADPGGRVTELARGNTLGLTDYTSGGSAHDFEIFYEPHRVRVSVDGVEQFNETGNFSEGRLGLYESHQNPGATFSNFNVEPIDPADTTAPPGPGPGPSPIIGGSEVTSPTDVDFNTYTAENYPQTAGFSSPDWDVSADGSSAGEVGNSSPTVFYGNELVHNTHISGTIFPTTNLGGGTNSEDDIFGLALGFNPGDTQPGNNADFLLLDWKGTTQDFNFTGNPGDDTTPGATAAEGLALSRVLGAPTTDELWGHTNFDVDGDGRVLELARGNTLSNTGYNTDGTPHQFDVFFSPDRVQVFVDGSLEIDESGSFANGRLGLFESHQSLGATFSDFNISPLEEINDPGGVVGANVDSGPGSTWTITAESPLPNGGTIVTAPNGGDFEIAFNGFGVPDAEDGVMIATVSENGAAVTAEAPFNHTGWGNSRHGIATANTPAGSEGNADVAVAFFPFNEGWTGGNVLPSGDLAFGQGVQSSDITLLASPNPGDQDGLYQVNIPDVNSTTDGLLFTVGASNEDNVTAAVPNPDGGWRVSVRDNGTSPFSNADGFENDDFGFVYVPKNARNLVGGRVEGFDAAGEAILDIAAGDFELTRNGVGQYSLQIDGVLDAAEEGMLLLTASEPSLLSDGELAPLNTYLSYEPDGSEFLIENFQLGPGGPTPIDGGFSFAFLDFDEPFSLVVPEPSSMALWLVAAVTAIALGGVWRRRRGGNLA